MKNRPLQPRQNVILNYLSLPAVVILWSLALGLRNDWRQGWLPLQVGMDAWAEFWLCNLVWLVLLPLFIAWAFYKEKPWARLPTWILCGSTGYAAMLITGKVVVFGNGFKGMVCMLALWGLSLIFALQAHRIR